MNNNPIDPGRMTTPSRRKKFRVVTRPTQRSDAALRAEQGLIVDGYAPSQMIEDLRKYQAELEVQKQGAALQPAGSRRRVRTLCHTLLQRAAGADGGGRRRFGDGQQCDGAAAIPTI